MNSNKFKSMKTTKLMRCVLFVSVLAAFGFAGCQKLDTYSIDAPSDLQSRVDSIAAAKPNTGDTTFITITTPIVGAEDNSTGWNGAHSDYFTIPANKLLHLEFVNHNGGSENNWNNWNLAVDVVKANSADYDPNNGKVGYFTLRSDAYGWGNDAFDLNMITQNYPDTNGDGDIWDDFRATMDGATVSMDIDHSVTGNVFVTVTAVGTNGTTLVETYQQPVSATDDIVAYLVCDASHFVMKKAYLLPSKITTVEDVNPDSLVVKGTPTFTELGNADFWGNATATVYFADGSSTEVDTTDLSFNVIPDMTTLGEKTVIVSYSKTKQGAYTQAVSTYYNIEVKMPVSSLAVTTQPNISTYYYFNSDSIMFNTQGLEVTGTYSDNTTGVIPNTSLHFSKIPAADGSQSAVVSYYGATDTVTTTCPLTLVKGLSQIGATDFSTPWPTYGDTATVASGSSKTYTMYCYSDNASNWHSPSVTVGKAGNLNTDAAATDAGDAVVRMDNYGWGAGYDTATLTSDWNWDIFTSSISGSKIVITVTNNGDNTADILYNVTYATGETHFQKYAGITVDSADLSCALVTEGDYLVIVK